MTAPAAAPLPQTYAECRAQMDALQREIREIERQTRDPNRCDGETGERLSYAAWADWRRRALYARQRMLEQYRDLKRQLHVCHQREIAHQPIESVITHLSPELETSALLAIARKAILALAPDAETRPREITELCLTLDARSKLLRGKVS